MRKKWKGGLGGGEEFFGRGALIIEGLLNIGGGCEYEKRGWELGEREERGGLTLHPSSAEWN